LNPTAVRKPQFKGRFRNHHSFLKSDINASAIIL
jgi:hypothetical protein